MISCTSDEGAKDQTPTAGQGAIPGYTLPPSTPGLEFSSFSHIETLTGFRVLRPDMDIYRYELINRDLETTADGSSFYDLYSRIEGFQETPLVSVRQQAATGQPESLVDFEGWQALVTVQRDWFEVRFLTGARDPDGREIEAIVGGRDESEVRALVATLSFSD